MGVGATSDASHGTPTHRRFSCRRKAACTPSPCSTSPAACSLVRPEMDKIQKAHPPVNLQAGRPTRQINVEHCMPTKKGDPRSLPWVIHVSSEPHLFPSKIFSSSLPLKHPLHSTATIDPPDGQFVLVDKYINTVETFWFSHFEYFPKLMITWLACSCFPERAFYFSSFPDYSGSLPQQENHW